jgi:hypothetical protein
MLVERGMPMRRFFPHGETQAPDSACGQVTRSGLVASRVRKVVFFSVCLPALLIALGAGDSLSLAYGQSESNAAVPTAVRATESGLSDQNRPTRDRSEPTVTGAAMHVALFVPRN